MGPVLGVLDNRYAGRAASRRLHLIRTPHFAPDGPQRPAQTPLDKAVGCDLLARGKPGVKSPHLTTSTKVDPPRYLASGATAYYGDDQRGWPLGRLTCTDSKRHHPI
jgi:hypothetical protein